MGGYGCNGWRVVCGLYTRTGATPKDVNAQTRTRRLVLPQPLGPMMAEKVPFSARPAVGGWGLYACV